MSTSEFIRPQPGHLGLLQQEAQPIVTTEGKVVMVWRLQLPDDPALLSEWARYFREHYCLDEEIEALRSGTGLSKRDYLLQLIFPDQGIPPGPGIRSGDFAEILVADYLEFFLGLWVPREKYAWKAVRNESIKGVDTVGFHLPNLEEPATSDVLMAFEVKAKLTGRHYEGHLQNAIDHSAKDYLRRAETLNATKRRLLAAGEGKRALVVERFQNLADHPYTYQSGAVAVLTDTVFESDLIANLTSTTDHPDSAQLDLLVIHGRDLMDLVHALYERAANEA